MSTVAARGRGFRSWASTADQTRVLTLERAVASLVPQLESAGFLWVDKSFDCGSVPVHTVNLEREVVPGRIDYVQIIFDKRHRARFQLMFGSKEKAPPHRWVRSGALVCKKKSESVEYKWWGARWWNLDKEAALVNAVDAAASLLPQLLQFLSDGVAGNNVWEARLGVTPT
jgi:hypothetical protein